ncbi:hypothetical protein ODZ83_00510 [Acaricomes phytoseiuli]|uniref:hypothetical protein n=1 Tax=Acaricomes phytoseiuli TaxID=291968 RepID=UPI000381F557|nr:hypothetical protein [Acaricomes phytoseiuli]MCW1248696.1 hypothetical protein [Acaricomes phytoseiuli]
MQIQLAEALNLASEEELAPLWMPSWMFGVVMLLIFIVLFVVTISFANLGNRHEVVEEIPDPHRQHPNNHERKNQISSGH